MPREEAGSAFSERLESLRRDQDRLERQLLAGERRFRRLARSVWSVQEGERRRLARELHDGVGQLLTALKQQLELSRVEPGPAGDHRIDSALELARRALDETRELSRLLRPSILDDLGLEAGLQWLARTHREGTGTPVELVCEGLDDGPCGDELQTLVFRVVQEALTNTAKHADASHVEVRVRLSADELAVDVRDDGCGFDRRTSGAVHDGLGLRGMRDRVELFDGRFDLVSRPGAGTRIEIRIPRESPG